ncbi:MAG: sigma-54-dependent Fis family transcriptional regulator [Deltaproteobacteria bacterium]|nr:MAG: sigma-54-dependent Fis family transcriptional regulator [Deltaproteobacteria bacterium]
MLRTVIDALTEELQADRGTLYLVDPGRRELVSRMALLPELSEIRLRIGEGVAGWVAEHGELVNVPLGNEDPRFARRIDAQTGYRTMSLLAAPVRSRRGDTVAVLQFLNKRRGVFTNTDEELLADRSARIARLLDHTSLAAQLSPGNRLPLAFRFNHIVGESAAMRDVYRRTARAAATEATVLLRGETGTGKELVAHAVHVNSARYDAPFVKVDCAALPANLVENELFGHERGAFTGADRRAEGKVHAAKGGTLFLDEIGELPLPVQGKLLRLLQDRTFHRVGATGTEEADVRFVCATHRDLESLVEQGAFRRDLYYRLRVVEIVLPNLRDRGRDDLERLIDHFVFEHARRHKRQNVQLTSRAREALYAYDWPGNVRELEHTIESAVVLSADGRLEPEHFPLPDKERAIASPAADDGPIRPLEEVELEYIRHVLDRCDGNKSLAARLLGIGRNTLARKLDKV